MSPDLFRANYHSTRYFQLNTRKLKAYMPVQMYLVTHRDRICDWKHARYRQSCQYLIARKDWQTRHVVCIGECQSRFVHHVHHVCQWLHARHVWQQCTHSITFIIGLFVWKVMDVLRLVSKYVHVLWHVVPQNCSFDFLPNSFQNVSDVNHSLTSRGTLLW